MGLVFWFLKPESRLTDEPHPKPAHTGTSLKRVRKTGRVLPIRHLLLLASKAAGNQEVRHQITAVASRFPNKIWLLLPPPPSPTSVDHSVRDVLIRSLFQDSCNQRASRQRDAQMNTIAGIHLHLKIVAWISTSCCYWESRDTSCTHLSIKTPLGLVSLMPSARAGSSAAATPH